MKQLQALDGVPELLISEGVPGLSMAYTSTGSSAIVADAWGSTSVEGGSTVTAETRFRAGSISKPLTAFAALSLSREGALDLDADVNSLVGSTVIPTVGAWQPVVTTRMLLAHVAGVGDTGGAEVAFHTLPGTICAYSGTGYTLIGRVISAVTGMPFEDAMRALVLGPLSMSSSTFASGVGERWRQGAARGHSGGQVLTETEIDPASAPAGGLWTTPSDLMRFAQAVNGPDGAQMLQGHPIEPAMGLGLFLTSEAGIDWWSHGGSGLGFESLLAGDAATGFTAVAMHNGGNASLINFEVLRLISTDHGPGPIVLGQAVWDGRAAWARMTEVIREAAGVYALPSGDHLVLETIPAAWGQCELGMRLPGQDLLQLLRVTDGQWRVPEFEAYLIYEEPDRVRLMQGGRNVIAQRVEDAA